MPICSYCGKNVSSFATVKIIDNKRFYFCNEEEAEIALSRKIEDVDEIKAEALLYVDDLKDKIYKAVLDVLELEKINAKNFDEEYLKWLDIDTADKVYLYISQQKVPLTKLIRKKSFSSSFTSLKYLSAIIRNNIKEYKPEKIVELQKNIDFALVTEVKKMENQRKKTLAELEEEFINGTNLD